MGLLAVRRLHLVIILDQLAAGVGLAVGTDEAARLGRFVVLLERRAFDVGGRLDGFGCFQLTRSSSRTRDPDTMTPSAARSARFNASLPPYPPRRPPAAITR